MSDFSVINAEIREDAGKGASRRLRRQGKIPAILYGGDRDALSLTLDHDPILHASSNEAFYSSILELRVGEDRQQRVVLRDVQRHPFKLRIMHMDFQRISEKQVIRLSIPLHFDGEAESPAGRTSGVVIQHLLTEVEIAALPKDLPEFLEVDLSEMDTGDSVMLADIQLPEGVTIPSLAIGEEYNVQVAIAIHIKEDQGTGAAAAAEAEALAEEEGLEGEVPVVGEEEVEEGAEEEPGEESGEADAE